MPYLSSFLFHLENHSVCNISDPSCAARKQSLWQKKRFPPTDLVLPQRRHVPQIIDRLRHYPQYFLYLFLCMIRTQRKPQGTMCYFMRPADRQQDMTGIKRSGSTGGTGGSTDASVVQQQKQTLPFDSFET